jgi:hypothetical protein
MAGIQTTERKEISRNTTHFLAVFLEECSGRKLAVATCRKYHVMPRDIHTPSGQLLGTD